jgi:hypothetical protein
MRSVLVALICAIAVGASARAETGQGVAITVEQSWARATTPGAKTAAAYMTIINNGPDDVRMIGASTPIAESVQFHVEKDDKGVMRMRRISAIDIKPGARFSFKPGGTHVMLVGVKEPLREGQTLPLTLDFETAGKVEVSIPIGKPGAMSSHDMSSMGK